MIGGFRSRARSTASTAKLRVHNPLSWPLRLLIVAAVAAAAAAAGMAIFEYGRNIGGPDRSVLLAQIDELNTRLREVLAERDGYAAQAASLQGELQVQKAAQEQLVRQVDSLEAEQTKLQSDLTFFESLLPAGKGDKGVVIRSFRVQPDPETAQLRYRLLVQQSGKPDKDFVGSVQLRVSFEQNSRGFTLDIPDPSQGAEAAKALELSFRHYQRLEGGFSLPSGAVARSVQVRILSGGETKLQQTFNL